MQSMASFRNLIFVSSCSLRRSLFCIFFDLFSKANHGYFLHENSYFFWIIQKWYRSYQYWEKIKMARGKKTVTKATHMYQNRRGVESRPEIHKMRRAPTPPTKGHRVSPISFPLESFRWIFKQILIADLISMLDWLVTQLRSLRHHGKVWCSNS